MKYKILILIWVDANYFQ
uniref:Uncharacterized protein n=1 Tax=Arundo donax TaxID=35708 RepID=A0A0A8YB57_ARUDO